MPGLRIINYVRHKMNLNNIMTISATFFLRGGGQPIKCFNPDGRNVSQNDQRLTMLHLIKKLQDAIDIIVKF